MNDPNTLTPELELVPTPPAPEAEPAFLARARRILAGDIHPDDYLPVTEEVTSAVEEYLQQFTVEHGFPAPEGGAQLLRNDWVLQFHHGGQEVLCRRTDRGAIVLATGREEVDTVVRHFPPEGRPGYAIAYPEPWN